MQIYSMRQPRGIVTANIATDSTVDSLATLTGTGNAYTIVIGSGDATGSNASDLIAIDNATTVAVMQVQLLN